MKLELCRITDIPADGALTVEFYGREALVYLANGVPTATLAICPHVGGPLTLRDGMLACAWHDARFEAASGRCTRWPDGAPPPSNHALQLPTRVEQDRLVYVWGE